MFLFLKHLVTYDKIEIKYRECFNKFFNSDFVDHFSFFFMSSSHVRTVRQGLGLGETATDSAHCRLARGLFTKTQINFCDILQP